MSDWTKPTIDSLHLDVIDEQKQNAEDAATLFDTRRTAATNIPMYAKRWNHLADKFEYWNGTAWVDLATVFGVKVQAAELADNATNADNANTLQGKAASAFLERSGGTMTGPTSMDATLTMNTDAPIRPAAGPAGGIHFPTNAYGGTGDTASITLEQKTGEDQTLTIRTTDDVNDTVNVETPAATGLQHNGNTVWDSGNDGPGSGLNADLLDGKDESAFAPAVHSHADVSGNAATADKWNTARTVALSGSVTGSASVDGSVNVTISTALAADTIGATHLQANSVGASEIAANAVGASEIAANAVGASEIAAGAVAAGKLKTTYQTMSGTANTINDPRVVKVAAVGGYYHFGSSLVWSNVTRSNIGVSVDFGRGTQSTSAVNIAHLGAWNSNSYSSVNYGVLLYARTRYIQASPPYDLGDGEIPLFIFALVENTTGNIDMISASPDAPWHHNGPTNTMADFYDKKGVGYQNRKLITPEISKLKGRERVEAIATLKTNPVEVTQAIKQQDMPLLPHPFIDTPLDNHTVVLLDPVADLTLQLFEYHEVGENINELLHEGYLKIGNESCGRCGPPGVLDVSCKWKKTTTKTTSKKSSKKNSKKKGKKK